MIKLKFLPQVCVVSLVCAATTASSISIEGHHQNAALEKATNQAIGEKCADKTFSSEPVGMVQFVHGRVRFHNGKRIVPRSTLALEDWVSVGADGFLSLSMTDGSTLNIQPDTENKIACELINQSETEKETSPHLSGAIRG